MQILPSMLQALAIAQARHVRETCRVFLLGADGHGDPWGPMGTHGDLGENVASKNGMIHSQKGMIHHRVMVYVMVSYHRIR